MLVLGEGDGSPVTYRVIVTGCRDWRDEDAVDRELQALLDEHSSFTLVHGACPTGTDEFARIWATSLDLRDIVIVEAHPADWKALGKGAGPARNQLIVGAGAHLCLAFWDGVSRGTYDMITRAVRYGIPVKIIPKVKRV